MSTEGFLIQPNPVSLALRGEILFFSAHKVGGGGFARTDKMRFLLINSLFC